MLLSLRPDGELTCFPTNNLREQTDQSSSDRLSFAHLLSIREEHGDESEIHASLLYELNLHLEQNEPGGLISAATRGECSPAHEACLVFSSDLLTRVPHIYKFKLSTSHIYAIHSLLSHSLKAP